jgi:hypothetical protein
MSQNGDLDGARADVDAAGERYWTLHGLELRLKHFPGHRLAPEVEPGGVESFARFLRG